MSPIYKMGLSLLALQLGLSILGQPGITAAPPALTYAGNGLLLILAALQLWASSRIGLLSGLTLGLAGISWLSSASSICPFLSDHWLAGQAGFTGAICLLASAVPRREDWRRLGSALVGWACLSGIYGLYLWLQNGSQGPLVANFTNQDCYSLLPLVSLFLSFGLALEGVGIKRIVYSLAGTFLTAVVFLTACRSSLLGLALGMMGFFFTLLSSQSQRYRALAAKFLVAVTSLLLIGIFTGLSSQVSERLSQAARGEDVIGVKSRLDVLRMAPKTVMRAPVLGVGPGCFALAYQQDRPPLIQGEEYMNAAHNDYAQWFVETGIGGGLLWTLLLAASVLHAWRSYKCPAPWAAGQIGLTLALAVYCLLNFACPVPADFLWAGAVLGLTAALPQQGREGPRPQAVWNPKYFPVTFLLLAWGLWTLQLAWKTDQSNRAIQQAERLETTLDWEGATQVVTPVSQKQPANFRLQLVLAELDRRLFLFTAENSWFQAQKTALQMAHQANPRDLSILSSQIRLLQEQRDLVEAEKLIGEAQELAPYSPHIKRSLVLNQIYQGRFSEATATLLSLGATGSSGMDVEALSDLIYLLESKSKGQGVGVLAKLARQGDERSVEVGLRAARRGVALLDYQPSLRLLQKVRSLSPERPDVLMELAHTRGLAGNPKQERNFLTKLRFRPDLDNDPEISEKIWRRWTELSLAQGDLLTVKAQLEDYLTNHPRQNWARLTIADISLRSGNPSEARSALRDGIAYDNDGSLRIRLGDICAQQGFIDLARGYYREALTLTSDRAQVEEKLRGLKSNNLEDPEEL